MYARYSTEDNANTFTVHKQCDIIEAKGKELG